MRGKFIDEYSMIVNTPPINDGGDSAQRIGMFYTLPLALRLDILDSDFEGVASPDVACKSLVDSDGRLRRHPDPDKWYSEFNRGSRDQYRAFVSGLGRKNPKVVSRMLKHFLFGTFKYRGIPIPRLGLFATNTKHNWQYADAFEHYQKTPGRVWNYKDKMPDYMGPFSGAWIAYIRGLGINFAYPLLYILDLKLVASSIMIQYLSDDKDILNHVIALLQSSFHMDTFVARLARKILKPEMIKAKLERYFDDVGDPRLMSDLYMKAIKNRNY